MKKKAGKILDRVLGSGLFPESIRWSLNRHQGCLRPDASSRRDLETIPINENAHLEVFWKDLKIGKGPAVSLFILGNEILRIDCFGPGDAHLHATFFQPTGGESRLFMGEPTIEEQIARARFELCRNFRYYQWRDSRKAVRRVQIHPSDMERAYAQACEIMHRFLSEVPIFQEPAAKQ
jgi:hypothetical protein